MRPIRQSGGCGGVKGGPDGGRAGSSVDGLTARAGVQGSGSGSQRSWSRVRLQTSKLHWRCSLGEDEDKRRRAECGMGGRRGVEAEEEGGFRERRQKVTVGRSSDAATRRGGDLDTRSRGPSARRKRGKHIISSWVEPIRRGRGCGGGGVGEGRDWARR